MTRADHLPPSTRWFLFALLLLVLACEAASGQTPPKTPACVDSAQALGFAPIYGVGSATIKNACPAFRNGAYGDVRAGRCSTVAQCLARWFGPDVAAPTPAPQPTPTPAPAPTPTPPPVGSGVVYADDFSSYTSTADFFARFWIAPPYRSWAAISAQPQITWDAAEKAIRYDWVPRPAGTACSIEQTVALMPRWFPPTPLTNIWITFTSKESPLFAHGSQACPTRSYKFFLVTFEGGTKRGRVGTYLFDGTGPAGPHIAARMWLDRSDTYLNSGSALPIGGDGPTGWGGAYHKWVIAVEGIGTAATTQATYLDGVKVGSITGPFMGGQAVGPGWYVMLEMGANINNGPDRAQSRWFRELGVYTVKPSLAPLPQ